MNKEKIISELKNLLIEDLFVELSEDEIENDMSLKDTLGVDSIGFTEISAFIEDQYDITVTEQELISDNFKSINNLIAFIESKATFVAA